MAYANGIAVLAEVLDVFRLRGIATGGRRLPSGNLFFAKITVVGWMSGVEPRQVRIALAGCLCDWGTERRESLWLKASIVRGGGPCSF
jgi:hypothetical protein